MEKSKYPSYKRCWVKYCENKISVKTAALGISYFTLPKDIPRRNVWIENCVPELADNNVIIKSVRICQEHFEDKMFLNVNQKNKLITTAIPTLFNDKILAKRMSQKTEESLLSKISQPLAFLSPTHNSSSSLSTSSSQTPLYLSYQTPREIELRKELRQAKEEIRALEKRLYQLENNSVESFLNQCQKFLSPNLILIIKCHLMHKEKIQSGYRYSNEIKQLALTIYFLGPKVYNFLKTTLCLPSIRTLTRT